MYFSFKEFCDGVAANKIPAPAPGTNLRNDNNLYLVHSSYATGWNKKELKAYFDGVKQAIINREMHWKGVYLGKWTRPWHVVPKLKSWRPAAGDFGVGVEVEMGFVSKSAAAAIAESCKNMKYVTADFEGGTHPIEMTFPPVSYSKIGSHTACVKYISLLENNRHLLAQHHGMVGTHVNVSVNPNDRRPDLTSRVTVGLRIALPEIGREACLKYFGREYPYGWAYQGDGGDHYFEFKLFNSVADKKQFKRYINIAVALIALANSDLPINRQSVLAACEVGFNKRGFNPSTILPAIRKALA